MAQSNWWLGVISAVGLVAACGSSDTKTSTPAPPGQAGATAAGASGAPTAGAAGAPLGGSGGASMAGASMGGAGPVTCTPACTATQACVEGKCLLKPVELARVEACGSMHLAVSKGIVYFTDGAHGNVKSVPVAGGTVTDVATGQKAPYAIAVDDAGTVYWSNSSATVTTDNTLMMKTTAGAAAKIADVAQPMPAVAGSTNIATSIALNGSVLYYSAGSDLMKVATTAASTPSKIGEFSGLPVALVLSPPPPMATKRIFSTLNQSNAVEWRSPDPAMSGCTDPITRPVPPVGETAQEKTARILVNGCSFSQSIGALLFDALSLAGNNVVFADHYTLYTADITVADATTPTTMSPTRAPAADTASFDDISGLTTTASTAYFGEATTGIVEKVALPTGTPVILVEDPAQIAPSSFINDGTNVYWRTGSKPMDACAIMKLPL
jgi:hypothetical protein